MGARKVGLLGRWKRLFLCGGSPDKTTMDERPSDPSYLDVLIPGYLEMIATKPCEKIEVAKPATARRRSDAGESPRSLSTQRTLPRVQLANLLSRFLRLEIDPTRAQKGFAFLLSFRSHSPCRSLMVSPNRAFAEWWVTAMRLRKHKKRKNRQQPASQQKQNVLTNLVDRYVLESKVCLKTKSLSQPLRQEQEKKRRPNSTTIDFKRDPLSGKSQSARGLSLAPVKRRSNINLKRTTSSHQRQTKSNDERIKTCSYEQKHAQTKPMVYAEPMEKRAAAGLNILPIKRQGTTIKTHVRAARRLSLTLSGATSASAVVPTHLLSSRHQNYKNRI